MPTANAERIRRHRAKYGRRERTTDPEVLRLRAEGKTPAGWLPDDGIVDAIAVEIAVNGDRIPNLTHWEAMLAAAKLVQDAKTKHNVSATKLISARLGLSAKRTKSIMSQVRQAKVRGDI